MGSPASSKPSRTVTALVVERQGGPFETKQVRLKDLQSHEMLVRMLATGVCHTDVASATGKMPPSMPAVLGHEGAGVVEEVGDQVHHVAVGDHVLLSFASCGTCKQCLKGLPSYCRDGGRLLFGGCRADGSTTIEMDGVGDLASPYFGQSSFAARSIVHGSCAVRVPKDVPLDILCPLGCAFQTGMGTVVNDLKPGVGGSIAVFGVGSVGLAAIIAAKNLTAATTVIAVDINDERLKIAAELGATHTINSKGKDVVQLIKDATDGEGVERALDCTGIISVIEDMIASAANRGVVATVGGAPIGQFVKIEAAFYIQRGVSYIGSAEGSSDIQTFLPALVELWKQGRLPIDRLISKYPYHAINEAIHDMHSSKAIKPVLIWD